MTCFLSEISRSDGGERLHNRILNIRVDVRPSRRLNFRHGRLRIRRSRGKCPKVDIGLVSHSNRAHAYFPVVSKQLRAVFRAMLAKTRRINHARLSKKPSKCAAWHFLCRSEAKTGSAGDKPNGCRFQFQPPAQLAGAQGSGGAESASRTRLTWL